MKKIISYIVKGKQVYVGLEDSKITWKLCIRSEGMIIDQLSIPAKYENLLNYFDNRYPDCKIKVMYETGFAGFWLHDALRADGIECIVTPAGRVTMEKVNAVKTDKRDARRLALNLENNDFTICHVPDRELREDRQINRTLNQVQKEIQRVKNMIRSFFNFHGINGDMPQGEWSDVAYTQIRSLPLSASLKKCLDTYSNLLEYLQVTAKELKKEVLKLGEKKRYQRSATLMESCPGVGSLSAIRFTLEWGDLTRFDSSKKFASYTGLTCSEYSTGENVRKGRITGQSRSSIRGWLVQCAWTSVRKDPALLEKYMAVWKNSGSKKKAIVAVARKLAVRLRAVVLTNTQYCTGVIE